MKKFFALISSLSISSLTLLVPLNIAQASDICEGGECEVVFEKTEEMESWQVPDGVREIYFEVRGAQGGADGGLGGIVSGSLVNFPSELQIIVGGAGVRASKTSGGFNGGGKSGGEHGNPGSGGGASDIRLGTELADRIVVAGGGGGFGGAAGGEGGAGGAEIASAGTDAQGDGGGGGTQEQGGFGGKSNQSEVDGESGQLGIGGRGGWGSYSAGGGGGGGGYFGGGGGGADSDFCCKDGGGGGGGSSFADTSYTKNVTFDPGANALDGSVLLRYVLPPNITDFSAQQVSPTAAKVSIEFDKDVTGVETSDFVLSGCQTMELSGEGQAYLLDIRDCEEEVVLTIQPNSIGQHLNAPKTERSIELTLDQHPPAISMSHPDISNKDSFKIRVETDDSGVFDLDAITSVDCEIAATEQEKALTIVASGCAEGRVFINFESEFLTDSIGNESLSKSKSLEVLIDTVAPVIEVGGTKFQDLKVENEWLVETTTSITVSESSLEFSDFVFDGANQCSTDFEQSDRAISLQTIRCPEVQVQWLLPSNSITDIAGNSAPSEDLLIKILVPAAKVDPPKQPEEETMEESEPENTEQAEQPEKPESDNPEQTEPENPEENQTDEREQPESEIDEPIASGNPDSPSQQPAPSPSPDNTSEGAIESENSAEVEEQNDAPSEDSSESVQEFPTTEAEQPSYDREQEDAVAEKTVREGLDSDSDVSGNVPDSQNPSPEKLRLDVEGETTIPVSQPREFSEIEEKDEPNIWAILLAGLLVLGLIFGVVFLTKNNSSRAIG